MKLSAKLDYEQVAPVDANATSLVSVTDIDGNHDVDCDNTNDDTEEIVEYTVVVTADRPVRCVRFWSGNQFELLNVDEAPEVTVSEWCYGQRGDGR